MLACLRCLRACLLACLSACLLVCMLVLAWPLACALAGMLARLPACLIACFPCWLLLSLLASLLIDLPNYLLSELPICMRSRSKHLVLHAVVAPSLPWSLTASVCWFGSFFHPRRKKYPASLAPLVRRAARARGYGFGSTAHVNGPLIFHLLLFVWGSF